MTRKIGDAPNTMTTIPSSTTVSCESTQQQQLNVITLNLETIKPTQMTMQKKPTVAEIVSVNIMEKDATKLFEGKKTRMTAVDWFPKDEVMMDTIANIKIVMTDEKRQATKQSK